MLVKAMKRLWKEQKGHVLADCAVPAILVAVTGIGYQERLLSLWMALAAVGGVLYVHATSMSVLHGRSAVSQSQPQNSHAPR
jgi:hypothetical protein